MCDRCDDLEEQVAYLSSELGLQVNLDAVTRLRSALGRTRPGHGRPAAAKMIAALYATGGRPLTRYQILESVPSPTGKDRDAKIVDVWVCFVRQALGSDIIENIWGHGYRLSAEGMERIAIILGDVHGKASVADVQEMHDRPSAELRDLSAHIAGILAHRDGDNGEAIAAVYRRIADRLTGQPRCAA